MLPITWLPLSENKYVRSTSVPPDTFAVQMELSNVQYMIQLYNFMELLHRHHPVTFDSAKNDLFAFSSRENAIQNYNKSQFGNATK